MRVLNSIKVERPSTAKLIDLRLDTRISYTESQIKVYRTKTQYTDLLFLYLEHAFLSQDFFDIPSIHSDLDDILVNMFLYLPNFFQNQNSEDNMYLAQRIMYQVDDILKEDMLNEYYYLPKTLYNTLASPAFEDLKRTDASQVDGQDDTSEDDDNQSEKADSKSADSESKGGAYLEMELHEGQNSETLGNDEAREGDATDDMTDMMTKKGKGSNDTLNREEGDAVGQSQAFQLDGVNKM